jgi:Fe2+ or Zn2+ uptake regulation protein
MDQLIDRLRARAGFRMTAQRRAVAEALSGSHVHLSAEEVHERARRALPEISLATVYNTLHELVALGEVDEHGFDGRTRRYDPNVGQVHHHLVCEGCGAIRDVEPGAEVPHPPDLGGFEVLSTEVTHRGRCADCRTA